MNQHIKIGFWRIMWTVDWRDNANNWFNNCKFGEHKKLLSKTFKKALHILNFLKTPNLNLLKNLFKSELDIL